MVKIFVIFFLKGVGFNFELVYSGVYIFRDNIIVCNYVFGGERNIIRFLIQDIEIYNCIRFCVILILMYFDYFVYDSDDLFEFYFVRFNYIDEVLLLLIVEWNLYIIFVIEYVFVIYFLYLSLNLYLNENIRIVLNVLFVLG